MKLRKVSRYSVLTLVFVFAVWQTTCRLVFSAPADDDALPKPTNRAESVRAVVSHLKLGEGSIIADIGAGGGRDTWVFAEIVGETGTVLAEEITENMVKSLKKDAEKKGLGQVRAVLGCTEDPCLPPNTADLAYMNHVYHHLAKPRPMLRGIWRGLKPGGYLVVVDRRKGTLRDWAPRHLREKKHFWIAETTVVREAREEGFEFVECAEQYWYQKDHFVLVFRRPKQIKKPGRDPDLFLPLEEKKCSPLLFPLAGSYQQPVFIALGQARKLMSPILEKSSGRGVDIILEEWATQKEERPALPSGLSMPSVLTDNGDPKLQTESVDVVFFLDTYHLLFHEKTLLAKIHEKLSPTGCVYVLDRKANESLSRRQASHRRKIQPKTVIQEMADAGFFLWARGPRPVRDRFLLVFGKTRPKDLLPKEDPFVGGPEIPETPGQWLRTNSWRLRGLKTVDGRYIALTAKGRKAELKQASSSADTQVWKIPKDRLTLHFDKKNGKYLFSNYQTLTAE